MITAAILWVFLSPGAVWASTTCAQTADVQIQAEVRKFRDANEVLYAFVDRKPELAGFLKCEDFGRARTKLLRMLPTEFLTDPLVLNSVLESLADKDLPVRDAAATTLEHWLAGNWRKELSAELSGEMTEAIESQILTLIQNPEFDIRMRAAAMLATIATAPTANETLLLRFARLVLKQRNQALYEVTPDILERSESTSTDIDSALVLVMGEATRSRVTRLEAASALAKRHLKGLNALRNTIVSGTLEVALNSPNLMDAFVAFDILRSLGIWDLDLRGHIVIYSASSKTPPILKLLADGVLLAYAENRFENSLLEGASDVKTAIETAVSLEHRGSVHESVIRALQYGAEAEDMPSKLRAQAQNSLTTIKLKIEVARALDPKHPPAIALSFMEALVYVHGNLEILKNAFVPWLSAAVKISSGVTPQTRLGALKLLERLDPNAFQDAEIRAGARSLASTDVFASKPCEEWLH